MYKFVPIVLFCGFCAVALMLGCSAKKESTSALLNQAAALASEANWRDALKVARKAVDQAPQDANAQLLYALALENTGAADDAIDYTVRATELDPDHFAAHYALGRMYYRKGKFDRAVSPLVTALKLKPQDRNTTLLLAQVRARQGHSDALPLYKVLANTKDLRKNAAIWNQMALLYLSQKKYRHALVFLREAEKLGPQDSNVALNLGIVNDFYFNDRASAKSYYEKYLALTARRADLEPKRVDVAKRLAYFNN